MSCRRATSAISAPEVIASATIRPLSSSLHRRRRTTRATSVRRRTMFVSSLMSTIMCTRSQQNHDRALLAPVPPCGVKPPLTIMGGIGALVPSAAKLVGVFAPAVARSATDETVCRCWAKLRCYRHRGRPLTGVGEARLLPGPARCATILTNCGRGASLKVIGDMVVCSAHRICCSCHSSPVLTSLGSA